MADIDNLEETNVLDFEDDSLPELPEDNPFDAEGAKRPWLLVMVGVAAVTLVAVVVLKLTLGGRVGTESVELSIDNDKTSVPIELRDDDFVKGADALVSTDGRPTGMPERVVDQRKNVTFDPDKPSVRRPKPRPVGDVQPPAKPTVPAAAQRGRWAVQVGSYQSRAAAEAGQKSLQSRHANLFGGQSMAILSAVLQNGATTYRLRAVGFQTGDEANSFCRNAKSDGVDCYVTK